VTDRRQKNRATNKRPLYYAQIPSQLIRDSKISPKARILYGILHSYSKCKNLKKNPKTFVSQIRLSKDVGCTVQTISNRINELKKANWILIRRRGWRSNVYILHPSPRKNG